MLRRSKPINADVPLAAGSPPPAATKAPPSPPSQAPPEKPGPGAAGGRAPSPQPPPPPGPSARRRRKPVPAALKAIGALVVVAVVFIVAAIVGGGGEDGAGVPGAPPEPETQAQPRQTTPAAQAPTTGGPADLGYPEFATNNTTRVGGGDPASNAAAVALAVFPSQQPAQRPAAVTVVNAEDWQSAIAASVLMAPPVRAPALISEAEELPEPTSSALDALDPQGSRATKGAQVFAIGGAAGPDGLQTTELRATGATGAAAIAALRDRLAGRPPRHVVIAPSDPSFAAPAAAWAARSGDPVLFSEADRLPRPTAEALERHPKVPVYVVGPSSRISSSVVRQIAEIDKKVLRISGESPVTNAIALARYESGDFGWDVNDPGHGFVVARSDSPLDAVAAAPLSASGTWGPLLLTDSADTLPPPLRDYLLDVKPGYTTNPTRAFYNHVWLIGDGDTISVAQQAEIDELAELAKIGGEP